jgi:hypothetical protein
VSDHNEVPYLLCVCSISYALPCGFLTFYVFGLYGTLYTCWRMRMQYLCYICCFSLLLLILLLICFIFLFVNIDISFIIHYCPSWGDLLYPWCPLFCRILVY